MSNHELVEKRIVDMPDGSIFAISDFADLAADNFVSVRTTTPERTFWEKATILHHEANRPEDLPVPPRFSRHYYDVYRMAKLGALNKALE